MNFGPDKVYPRTLWELLDEDMRSPSSLALREIRKKYEGWILYLISKGNLSVIQHLVEDLKKISCLGKDGIVALFKNLKTQITIELDLSIDFTERLEPFFLINDKNKKKFECDAVFQNDETKSEVDGQKCEDLKVFVEPRQEFCEKIEVFDEAQLGLNKDSCTIPVTSLYTHENFRTAQLKPSNYSEFSLNLENHSSNLLKTDSSSSSIVTQTIPNKQNLEIEEFFHSSILHSNSQFSSLPTSPEIPTCGCNFPCSNQTFCTCSRFIASQIGIQKPLLLINNKKRLPRRWRKEYFIFECQKLCKCDKFLCNLTFFSKGVNYFPKVQFAKGESKANQRILRGEFVMEISGQLSSSPFEKGVQLGEGIYKDLKDSNVRNINEDKEGNVIPVRIFGYRKQRIVCRVVLFAAKAIEQGEIVSLDFNQLETFMGL